MERVFDIPAPALQVAFSEEVENARGRFFKEALRRIVDALDQEALSDEIRMYVPEDGLHILRSCGLRPEIAFCVPLVLRTQPCLLGYYRLLLGFSRKKFYSPELGLGGTTYMRMEDENILPDRLVRTLPQLCLALNQSANYLIQQIPRERLTAEHLDDLILLTYGTQLRGGSNVSIGQEAVKQVFDAIRKIVGPHASRVGDNSISVIDATDREISIRLSPDPDVEIVTVGQDDSEDAPLLAIEIKGGTDISNIHNRLGEAEKSHLRAKERRFTDRWTIVNVKGVSEDVLRRSSPTTTEFFNLYDIVSGQGSAYQRFRETLLQKLRLPSN